MAHFARLDENNNVLEVLVIDNKDALDENGVEQELVGIQFLKNLFGQDTIWVQTSYNSKFRKNYAALGGTYDLEKDGFIPPKQFNSWVLDEDTLQWKPPIDKPDFEHDYMWRESDTSWVQVIAPPVDYETVPYRWNIETEEWERIE